MRPKNTALYDLICDTIKSLMIKNSSPPCRRLLSKTLNKPNSTICHAIQEMEKIGLVKIIGRTIITNETRLRAVPVLRSLSDPNHIFDKANIKDFVFASDKILGIEGDVEIAVLPIYDNSMEYANIRKGNQILAIRQKFANDGQIVIALCPEKKYYLRRYHYDSETQTATLTAESSEAFPTPETFEIRGVAIRMTADL